MKQIKFEGCKLALFDGDKLLAYRRDNKADILYPNMFDLPGGQAEGNEMPEQCVLRELHEEFSLILPQERLEYSHTYSVPFSNRPAYFFAATLIGSERDLITLGEEGQYFKWMTIQEYLNNQHVIEHHKMQLKILVQQVFGAFGFVR